MRKHTRTTTPAALPTIAPRGVSAVSVTAAGLAALLLGASPSAHGQIPEEYEITAVIVGPFCNDIFPFPPTKGQGITADGVVAGYYDACVIGPEIPFIWTQDDGLVDIPMPGEFQHGRAFGIDGSLVVGHASFDNDDLGKIAFTYDIDSGEIEIIGVPDGGTYSELMAVSNGRAVGNWGNNVLGNPSFEAFIWEDGVFTSLAPDLGTPNSKAEAVNGAGAVTGWMGVSRVFDGNAYIWHEGEVTVLPVIPGGFTSRGQAINEHGDVAGYGILFDKDLGENAAHAFAYIDGVMHVIEPLPGFPDAEAKAISDNGTVVGHSQSTSADAFIWYQGETVRLDDLIDPDLGIDLQGPKAIRSDGVVVCGAVEDFQGGPDKVVTVILTPVFPPLGDIDGDGVVGSGDLIILLGAWGRCPGDCPADLDGDGVVGTSDLILLLGNWG